VCYTRGVTVLETKYSTLSPLLLFLGALLLTCCLRLLCVVLLSCVYPCYLMYIVLLCVYCCLTYLVAGLLASSQYPEGPATGHLGTGFSWFPCV
jgi:hypothetical protein